MTFEAFKDSLSQPEAPSGLPPQLIALWWDARGDWHRAHEVAQEIDTADAAWVHAYLHRKEGDLDNAGYWYRRAGLQTASDALETEWERIVRALLR